MNSTVPIYLHIPFKLSKNTKEIYLDPYQLMISHLLKSNVKANELMKELKRRDKKTSLLFKLILKSNASGIRDLLRQVRVTQASSQFDLLRQLQLQV